MAYFHYETFTIANSCLRKAPAPEARACASTCSVGLVQDGGIALSPRESARPERVASTATIDSFGTWRSLVAHLLWEQGVASSNLAVPTTNSGNSRNRVLPLCYPVALSVPATSASSASAALPPIRQES